MTFLMRALLVSLALLVGGSAGWGAVDLFAQQPPPQQQDEFVPIDQLPPQDQLPAAPLLVAAYSCVVLALFAYMVSVGRRLGQVQREVARLESDLKADGRK